MEKKIIRGIVLKVVAVADITYAMVMYCNVKQNFTKFTTLSNIGVGIALLLFLIADIIRLKYGKDIRKQWMYVFKFVMTLAIFVTFLIYICVLAPTSKSGFLGAYFLHGARSFCAHFVSPILAILDFFLFDDGYKPKKTHAVVAITSMLVYVVYVIIAAECFGVRWSNDMKAPYNFLNYGAPTGWFGFDLSLISSKTLGVGVAFALIVLLAVFMALGQLFIQLKTKALKNQGLSHLE